MYVNKCIKCGREFETKNPKRVICPDCLYPDKKMIISVSDEKTSDEQPQETKPLASYSTEEQPKFYSSYSAGGDVKQTPQRTNRPRAYSRDNRQNNNYNRYNNQRRDNNNRFNRNNRPQNKRPRMQNNFRKPNRPKTPRQLLVSKEQLEQIEKLYKTMLPLPNPDAHEVIGEKIGLEPRKVFFGINLIRQKLMLPKLPYPKRKLAISPDQLFAIKNLYEPLLPLPPIGCHKIIAAQLKMDEWRVHVGIGLIRSQMGLERWNQDREDAPPEFKKQPVVEEKPKRGRKPKKEEVAE